MLRCLKLCEGTKGLDLAVNVAIVILLISGNIYLTFVLAHFTQKACILLEAELRDGKRRSTWNFKCYISIRSEKRSACFLSRSGSGNASKHTRNRQKGLTTCKGGDCTPLGVEQKISYAWLLVSIKYLKNTASQIFSVSTVIFLSCRFANFGRNQLSPPFYIKGV